MFLPMQPRGPRPNYDRQGHVVSSDVEFGIKSDLGRLEAGVTYTEVVLIDLTHCRRRVEPSLGSEGLCV